MCKCTLKNILLVPFFLLTAIMGECPGETYIVPNIKPGKVISQDRTFWGETVLLKWMTIRPDSEFPVETLPAERFMVVVKGSVEQLVNTCPSWRFRLGALIHRMQQRTFKTCAGIFNGMGLSRGVGPVREVAPCRFRQPHDVR